MGNRSPYELKSKTQEEEDAYDIVGQRNLPKPVGTLGTTAHVIKGALGAGILSSHVTYMKAGYGVALIGTAVLGAYLGFCLWILVISGQKLCKRAQVAHMTYPEVGEAAFACAQNPKLRKMAKPIRYWIDITICIELFGACACYQLIIAKSIKQLVDDTPNGPRWSMRVYIAIMIIPIILICLLRHLQSLAPLSIVANCIILLCICVAIFYAFKFNPKIEGMVFAKDAAGFLQFCGMTVFSMSCAGIVVNLENNMGNPYKFSLAFGVGMTIIVLAVMTTGFFGYVAFLEKCASPLTYNFPMTIFPKIIKITIAIMIYITHALNFWAPFNVAFHYIKKKFKPEKQVMAEYLFRVVFVLFVAFIALVFPSINDLMGFLGVCCHSLLSFLWPQMISLLVFHERPGFGKLKWRLWRGIICSIVACCIFVFGSIVTVPNLYKVVGSKT